MIWERMPRHLLQETGILMDHSMLLHDDDGLIQETHSVSAGLTIRCCPEHAFLQSINREIYIGKR